MEKLKKIGEVVASVFANLGIIGLCALVIMSLLTAVSGCGSKKEAPDKTTCREATPEEVAKELGGGEKIFGINGEKEEEVLQNRPNLESPMVPKEEETPLESEPIPTEGASCSDIFGKASTIKCEKTCECVPNKAIVDEIEKQLPDSPALQSAWKELGLSSLKGAKVLNDSAGLPPIKDLTVLLGTSCTVQGGGLGTWVSLGGYNKPLCVHLPERGSN